MATKRTPVLLDTCGCKLVFERHTEIPDFAVALVERRCKDHPTETGPKIHAENRLKNDAIKAVRAVPAVAQRAEVKRGSWQAAAISPDQSIVWSFAEGRRLELEIPGLSEQDITLAREALSVGLGSRVERVTLHG